MFWQNLLNSLFLSGLLVETALDFGNDKVDNIFAQELQTIPLKFKLNDFGAILLPLAGGALVEGKVARCITPAEVFDPAHKFGREKIWTGNGP